MNQLRRCLPLYIGCNTNKGRLVGVISETLVVETEKKETEEYTIDEIGQNLFLYLRQLNDLTEEQSKQLIEEGLCIGRPHGYTFSNDGFLYLLSLSVDLFGLIKSGYAMDTKMLNQQDVIK